MDLGWFGCVCCPAAWELLRAGSTCPCQNVHRDIIPCNSLLRQKGVEKSCWLESWILCMAFHNAVWLISMVKIRQLFPSCTGTTKATTWQTEWAVMAANYVQSHWSCWIVLSNLWAVCRRLQQTLLGQLAMCVSDATTRLCEFWTCGNFNSASIWLIGIRRQVFLQPAKHKARHTTVLRKWSISWWKRRAVSILHKDDRKVTNLLAKEMR